MTEQPKILETKKRIRFQHCDPFNHLNNAEYLNYMVNAREDQLLKYYGIDIYAMGRTEGKSWVVGSNQIAYIKPAFTMETVLIQSQLMDFDETSIFVELRMYNEDGSQLKALMWSRYVHFNLLTQRREQHDTQFMELFAGAKLPVAEKSFEQRVASFKKPKAVKAL